MPHRLPATLLVLIGLISACRGGEPAATEFPAIPAIPATFRSQPQWLTGPRLLRMGEPIEFRFFLPVAAAPGSLEIFPRYLEQATPGEAFRPDGGLEWLDRQQPETLPLEFHDGQARVIYTPPSPGNYLARWRLGEETLYRYFSVVDRDSVVVNFATFFNLDPDPALHATGIPLDYRLPVRELKAESKLYQRLLDHHRRYGELVVLEYPDLPASTAAQREEAYAPAQARPFLPDGNDLRSIRVCADHEFDPGYVETFQRLGINDHCGLWEADGGWWLGMPEFFYFSAPGDCRRVNQGPGGAVVEHAWDFCAGFHFLGPTSWHYAASLGEWGTAEACLMQGLQEARMGAELSGHPLFVTPLYDGSSSFDYVNDPQFLQAAQGFADRPKAAFVEQYLRFMAFEAPKRFPLVYSRTLDMVDYFRRHYPVTPRTVYVSKTEHPLYDGWWSGDRMHLRFTLRNRSLAWNSQPSTLRRLRESLGEINPVMQRNKDKRAEELIVVEDQRRSLRFERESLYPIWWFDYTQPPRTDQGSPALQCVDIPDLQLERSAWTREQGDLVLTLKIKSPREIDSFPICLWDVPAARKPAASEIHADADEVIVAQNTDGEVHLVLVVNLKRQTDVRVRIAEAATFR